MTAISRIRAAEATEPRPGLWSNCLLVNGVAYVSGLTARGPDFNSILGADEYEQSRVIFGKIKALVEAAGGKMGDVVKLTIFVTNIKNREGVWKARSEAFSGDFPACTLVEVSSLASKEILVEIEAVAHIGASNS